MRAPITLALLFASGCSLLVPSPSDYTPDLVDAGQVDGDAGRDAGRDGGTDGGLSCEPGLTPCDGACVDTERALEHCGACGNACASTDVCRAGACFDPVIDVAAGSNHTCAVRASGAVWCWGKNETGQLGTGDFVDYATPQSVADLTGAIAISSAGSPVGGFPGANCATLGSGEVMCWGVNESSQLGDATATTRNRPVAVETLSGAVRGEIGISYACARRAAIPYVVCWGRASDGTVLTAPTTVSDLPALSEDFVDLAVALGHACGLTVGGQVWCWGGNHAGQLGDGSTSSRNAARVVSGLDDVVEVVAGVSATCARQSSGQVWCWGTAAVLGVGMTTLDPVSSPQQVSTVSNARRLFGGATSGTFCALRTDGSTWCWGVDLSESARTGSLVYDALPEEMAGLADVVHVAPGLTHACATSVDGDLYCWGQNQHGQIGDGTLDDRLVPTAVPLPD